MLLADGSLDNGDDDDDDGAADELEREELGAGIGAGAAHGC